MKDKLPCISAVTYIYVRRSFYPLLYASTAFTLFHLHLHAFPISFQYFHVDFYLQRKPICVRRNSHSLSCAPIFEENFHLPPPTFIHFHPLLLNFQNLLNFCISTETSFLYGRRHLLLYAILPPIYFHSTSKFPFNFHDFCST